MANKKLADMSPEELAEHNAKKEAKAAEKAAAKEAAMQDPGSLSMWVKPSGAEVPVNNYPASVAKAEELGWKRA